MVHYQGLPITPATAALKAISGGHAFISFAHSDQLSLAIDACQSFAVDNGAFSAWRSGNPVSDWSGFYKWVDGLRNFPGFDFAVIPDVIDGDEKANDALIEQWPWASAAPWIGAPVWHMHESIERLDQMSRKWPRICLGSSGRWATVGNASWWQRMSEAMNAICDNGLPRCKLHGLRMLNPEVFSRLPLSSADSTNIGRNVGIDSAWWGTYSPPTKEARAMAMRERIESVNGAQSWLAQPVQKSLFLETV